MTEEEEEEEEEDTIDKWEKIVVKATHNAYTHTRNTNVLSKFILRIAFLTSVWKYINKKKVSRAGARVCSRVHIIHILYIIVISVRRRRLVASASSCRCPRILIPLLKFDLFVETSSTGTNIFAKKMKEDRTQFSIFMSDRNRVISLFCLRISLNLKFRMPFNQFDSESDGRGSSER